jgi:hypothetical protein
MKINLITILTIWILLFLSGCATTVNYTPYRTSEILQGKGGSIRTVDGIDFWENGEPDLKYKIIGIIDYKSTDAPIYNMSLDSKIVAKCKQHNGDGVILIKADKELITTNYTQFQGPTNFVASENLNKKIHKYQVVKYLN